MEDSAPAIFSLFKTLFKKDYISIFIGIVMIYLIVSRNSEIDESIKSQKKTETAVLLIQKDMEGIKENFDNHITDTDNKIDDLSSDVKYLRNRFDNLYDILLKENIKKK